ncbi:MAG: hypothetical protein IJN51_01230 [Alistipes sp.]|nr:hypothetical protein [Alistipes sp.]MBQ8854042.1 hypothetical protein [Alistipes sp.]
MIMYGATLPSYNKDKDGKKPSEPEQEVVKADDPKNRERVRAILDSYD